MHLRCCKLAFRVLEGPIDSLSTCQLTPARSLTRAQFYKAPQVSQKSCCPAEGKRLKPWVEAPGLGDLWVNQKLFAVVRKSKVGFLNQHPSPLSVLTQLQGIIPLGAPIWRTGLYSGLSSVTIIFSCSWRLEEVDRKRKMPLDGFGGVLTEYGMLSV